MHPNTLMRFVDQYRRLDARCPGKINDEPLILIAVQKGARFWNKNKVKNYIYRLGKNRDIYYKKSKCHVMAVRMGVSIKRLSEHPSAVPMEMYSRYFLDDLDPDWLKLNRFELV